MHKLKFPIWAKEIEPTINGFRTFIVEIDRFESKKVNVYNKLSNEEIIEQLWKAKKIKI